MLRGLIERAKQGGNAGGNSSASQLQQIPAPGQSKVLVVQPAVKSVKQFNTDHVIGLHPSVGGDFGQIYGDVSNLTGDVSLLRGEATKALSGNATGRSGNITGVMGNISYIPKGDIGNSIEKRRG